MHHHEGNATWPSGTFDTTSCAACSSRTHNNTLVFRAQAQVTFSDKNCNVCTATLARSAQGALTGHQKGFLLTKRVYEYSGLAILNHSLLSSSIGISVSCFRTKLKLVSRENEQLPLSLQTPIVQQLHGSLTLSAFRSRSERNSTKNAKIF